MIYLACSSMLIQQKQLPVYNITLLYKSLQLTILRAFLVKPLS